MATKHKFEFDKVVAQLQQLKPKLPQELANIARNSFVMNFRTESFFGNKWQPRKINKYNKKGKTKPILVKSGKLRREVGDSIKEVNWNEIKLRVDLPYAKYHNEGTSGRAAHKRAKTIKAKVRGSGGFVNGKFTKGRSKTIKLRGEEYDVSASNKGLPKREFMGNHPQLNNKIRAKIQQSIRQIFK
jgi:phage gpG-like protein